MRIHKRIAVSAIALALLLTGCNGGSTGGGSNTAFTIGGTAPLTGSAAIYGTAVRNGAQIAVDEINAAGAVKLNLLYEDDENSAEKARNAYNAIKDKNLQLFLGSVTSTPGTATADLAAEDKIFTLTPSASAADVIGGVPDPISGVVSVPRKDTVFQLCYTDPNQGVASAKYIYGKKIGTKIAVIEKNDDVYSVGITNSFKKEAETLGLNIVSTSTFTESTQNDFSVQLTEAKNAGADMVFLPMYYTPASLILSQAKTMGYTPKFFGVDGMDGILAMDGFDKSLAEGVILLTPFNADSTDTEAANFVEKYKTKYGETPNQFAADAYDSVYVYKALIEKSGVTPDMNAQQICEKLVPAITAADFTLNGLTGANMKWNSTGAVSKEPKGMIIKNGSYVGLD